MLRHETETTSTGSPANAPATAAEERVTPDEFNRALAAIEARRSAQAERATNTVPIGYVVRELDLDVAPEEILAEVRRERQQAAEQLAESLEDDAGGSVTIGRQLSELRPREIDVAQEAATVRSELEGRAVRERLGARRAPWIGGLIAALVIWLAVALMIASANQRRSGFGIGPVVSPTVQRPTLRQPGIPHPVASPDAEFRRQLAETLGPNPRLCMVSGRFGVEPNIWNTEAGSVYPIDAVPQGYPIYIEAGVANAALRPSALRNRFVLLVDTADVHIAHGYVPLVKWPGGIYRRGYIRDGDMFSLKHGGQVTLYGNPEALAPGQAWKPVDVLWSGDHGEKRPSLDMLPDPSDPTTITIENARSVRIPSRDLNR